MNKLHLRLARLCLCAAAMTTIASTTALAGGNGSLFSANTSMLAARGADTQDEAGDPSQSKPLLYMNTGRSKRERQPDITDDGVYIDDIPIDVGPEQLVPASASRNYSQRDLECMAEAIYHEARGESRQGQAAVAEVILNRVDSRQFPSSVCGVVNQPAQFSYTIGGAKPMRNKAAYLRARTIAEAALSGAPRNLTQGATYFHTPAVRPGWSHRFQRTVKIGGHIFYRSGQRVASN